MFEFAIAYLESQFSHRRGCKRQSEVDLAIFSGDRVKESFGRALFDLRRSKIKDQLVKDQRSTAHLGQNGRRAVSMQLQWTHH